MPTTATMEARTLGSYDAVRTARAEFEDKVEDNSATRVDLIRYILTIDEAGYETIPTSMGMQWIHRNSQSFQKLVGDVDSFLEHALDLAKVSRTDDVEDIEFMDGLHALRYWFLRSIICFKELMGLLTQEWRETFVRDIYPKVGASNSTWISAVVLCGVPREMIAQAILKRLEHVKVEKGMANDVEEFLRYGGGGVHDAPIHVALRSLGVQLGMIEGLHEAIAQDPTAGFTKIEQHIRMGIQPKETAFGGFPEIPPWFVLNNDELAQALQICAIKAPAETLNILRDERIKPRLKDADVDTIVTLAYRLMTSLSGVNISTLERLLTFWEREELARQLTPVDAHYLHKTTAQFLFQIVLELSPRAKREEFWESVVVPVLKSVPTSTLYCAWRQLMCDEDEIEQTLLRWLDEEDYAIGMICKRPHFRGGMQMCVDDGLTRYVQAHGNHRYFPKKGDLVLFKRDGHPLTLKVVAVNFIPVMKDAT